MSQEDGNARPLWLSDPKMTHSTFNHGFNRCLNYSYPSYGNFGLVHCPIVIDVLE